MGFVVRNLFFTGWILFAGIYVGLEFWSLNYGNAPGKREILVGSAISMFCVMILSVVISRLFETKEQTAARKERELAQFNWDADLSAEEKRRYNRQSNWFIFRCFAPLPIIVLVVFFGAAIAGIPIAYFLLLGVGLMSVNIDQAVKVLNETTSTYKDETVSR